MLKRRLKDAGLSDAFSPHSFRATGITNFLENGGTLEVAQRIAGHATAGQRSSMIDVGKRFYSRIWKGFVTKTEGFSMPPPTGDQVFISYRRPTLICGAAGCGKTLLAMEFLVRGATECDEPGAFLTPSKQSAWCSTPSKVLPLEWRQGEIKQQPLRDNAGAEQAPFVRQTAPRKTGISQQQHGCSHPELP